MDLITLLVYLIVICVVFWAVRALLGAFAIGEPIATVVQVLLVVLVLLALVGALTGSPSLGLRLR
jgi:uncharacterized membrane protein YwzB